MKECKNTSDGIVADIVDNGRGFAEKLPHKKQPLQIV